MTITEAAPILTKGATLGRWRLAGAASGLCCAGDPCGGRGLTGLRPCCLRWSRRRWRSRCLRLPGRSRAEGLRLDNLVELPELRLARLPADLADPCRVA